MPALVGFFSKGTETLIYTIGHSAASKKSFLADLSKYGIKTVIDIRTHPLSKWAHFNLEELMDTEGWLAKSGIQYQWRSSLAGWQTRHAKDQVLSKRMAQLGVDLSTYDVGYYPRAELNMKVPTADPGTGWVRRHEVDFSWYTVLPEFQTGVFKLLEQVARGEIHQPVLMCSEYDHTKCHRSQVADFITYHHSGVTHLVGDEQHPHDWNQLRRMNRYDPAVVSSWGRVSNATT